MKKNTHNESSARRFAGKGNAELKRAEIATGQGKWYWEGELKVW